MFLLGTGLAAYSAGADLKVGIYKSVGAAGMQTALEQAGGLKVSLLDNLEADTLFRYDVIVLGSVKGLPQRSWGEDLQVYAQCGGGVLLCHDSVGFRGWNEPLFPQIFKDVAQSFESSLKVTDPKHPAAQDLPATFEAAYQDHMTMTPCKGARVLVKDKKDKPAVVAGEVGQCRVIGCGLLPGYAFIRGQNVDKPPEGGERQLLVQSVRWLGETRVTALAKEELGKRRRNGEDAMSLKRAAEVVVPSASLKGGGGDNKSWFDESMLNEQIFVHPPMELLPGRFFVFDAYNVGILNRANRPRAYGEILLLLKELKWMGVTDIIAASGEGPHRLTYQSALPEVYLMSHATMLGFDPLAMLTKACHEVGGLNIWIFWHSIVRPVPEKKDPFYELMIRDPAGEIYGNYIDINNPKLRDLCRRVMDELAAKYNKYGNIKGVFLDEFWHPFSVDRQERYIPEFITYCKENYGEEPPADIAAKFALGRKWHAPEDVWWRRRYLWRNTLIVDYVHAMTQYAHQKGFQIMNQPIHTQDYRDSWSGGFGDLHGLAKQGDLLWMYANADNNTPYLFEAYPRDRIILGTHYAAAGGWQQVALARGCAGSQFTLGASLLPVAGGYSPRSLEVLARTIRANREWYGAEILADVAVLTCGRSLDLQCDEPNKVFAAQDRAVREALGERFTTSMLMTEDTGYYARYKVLVAPPYSLNGLSAEQAQALQAYVAQGGCLILLDGAITISRPDFTQIQDQTGAFTGLRRLPGGGQTNSGTLRWVETNGAASFTNLAPSPWEIMLKDEVRPVATLEEGGRPLITERIIKKGRVVTVQFNLPALLAAPDTRDKVTGILECLVRRIAWPAIYAEGNVRVMSTLKQGNWIMISLLGRASARGGREEYPARGRVFFDMQRLGIVADKYRVFSLARDREIMPQGKQWDLYGNIHWTADNLASNGVGVYIAPDELMNLALPTTNKNPRVVEYLLPRWNSFKKTRTYEHEIIAVAPAGEATAPGEMAPKNPK